MNIAPTLVTSCTTLHLAGRRSPEAPLLSLVQTCASRFGAARSSPEGAAAPAARQSRFRGPCSNEKFVRIWRLEQ